jgi:predicted NAD/FAD-binding protein
MKRVAIVGTGIAGLSCAYTLAPYVDLSIYEKNDYVGGHTNTVMVEEEGKLIPIDTGFMVYNETTYPQLTALFQTLKVPTEPTCMSFSVQHTPSQLEFSGNGWNGLFAQRKNLYQIAHWKLLFNIHRFNTHCEEILSDPLLQKLTLQEYCRLRNYSEDFQKRYLIPMASAVWSSCEKSILDFPALSLVRFFSQHRFLSLKGQFTWRTVTGGSRVYRDLLTQSFEKKIQISRAIASVRYEDPWVYVKDQRGTEEKFNAVVIATHADEALALLNTPTLLQKKLLSVFHYQKNEVWLHRDERVMPKNRRTWSSWNYKTDGSSSTTIYWMNRLQKVSQKKNYFISINGPEIDPKWVVKKFIYEHPLMTLQSSDAQNELPKLNEKGPVFFCGSYFKYGFHEDALQSGLDAATHVRQVLCA